MQYHIGIVEDDPNIQNIVAAYLHKEGYTITTLGSAEEAWELSQTNEPHMWILDLMLPGMDGYSFCKKVREQSDVPIIIISAKDEEVDKILGLELGGDDYLTKPFSPRELVARVKRLFARIESHTTGNDNKFRIGNIQVFKSERRVFIEKNECSLTVKEFDMLNLFVEHPNRAFSREELLQRIWGDNYFGSDRAVDDLVKRIRQKVQGIPLETVWGYGYRLNGDVSST
ncbi:MAG TPA: response regulator transcription factor [Virgibacillus sp.]|nr:response regulator transcription factor [Virgibacillus sp.]